MHLKGTSVGLRPVTKPLYSLQGSGLVQYAATRQLHVTHIQQHSLLPVVTAVNFKALCTTVVLEATFTLHKYTCPHLVLEEVCPPWMWAPEWTQQEPAPAFYCSCNSLLSYVLALPVAHSFCCFWPLQKSQIALLLPQRKKTRAEKQFLSCHLFSSNKELFIMLLGSLLQGSCALLQLTASPAMTASQQPLGLHRLRYLTQFLISLTKTSTDLLLLLCCVALHKGWSTPEGISPSGTTPKLCSAGCWRRPSLTPGGPSEYHLTYQALISSLSAHGPSSSALSASPGDT